MRDQVLALTANGVPAAFINSSLSEAQQAKALIKAKNGAYKLIYAAPERLMSHSMFELTQTLNISLVVVDESHCISQWGHDFRPSYLDIPRFVASLPVRPVVAAFTATATPPVRKDILEILELRDPFVVAAGFDRPNLFFEVRRPKDKYLELKKFINERDGAGIVYCATRKTVESVAANLTSDGFSAARYHAGLSENERTQSQDDFLYDRVRIIVATNAFGMGINKSNVRFVVHYNMPQNIESYYQEAGRAGRDGQPGTCALFFARKDVASALFLINKSENEQEKSRNRQLLNKIERYCETYGCLRRFILEYFGERMEDDCENCSNCNGAFAETDATVDAQKILSCVARVVKNWRDLGFGAICRILQGKTDAYLVGAKLDKLTIFGLMSSDKPAYIRLLFDRLVSLKYIALSKDEYRTARLTPKAREVLTGGVKVVLRQPKTDESSDINRDVIKNAAAPKYAFSESLFEKLKELRREIAEEANIPAFVVFHDATLIDMCQKLPQAKEDFLKVSGVGTLKLERYGERFLRLLKGEIPAPWKPLRELNAVSFFENLELTDESIGVQGIANNINAVLTLHGLKRTNGAYLNRMIIEAGFLETVDNCKTPTAKGRELGITTIERRRDFDPYTQCVFDRTAQKRVAEMFLREINLS
jgi:ATP-dependent DNA helicase RecQ